MANGNSTSSGGGGSNSSGSNSSKRAPETITNTAPAAPTFRIPNLSAPPAVRPQPTSRLLPNGAIKNRRVGFSKSERWFNPGYQRIIKARKTSPPRSTESRGV